MEVAGGELVHLTRCGVESISDSHKQKEKVFLQGRGLRDALPVGFG